MSQLAVAEELRQHGQRAGGERLINEGFLPVEGFDGRTTRQRIFACLHIRDLRI